MSYSIKTKYFVLLLLLSIFFALPGCSSVGKGIAEAVLERKTEDERQCSVKGQAFSGVIDSIESQAVSSPNKTTKILVVHGIGRHIPGYSSHFKDQLIEKLGLDVQSEGYKEIKVQSEDFLNEYGEPEEIGVLRITRHQNVERTQDVLFYELTWSHISDQARAALAFDNSEEYNYQRTKINKSLKGFVNSTVPDLMVYRGAGKQKINESVAQAVCWTFYGDWQDLPSESAQYCDAQKRDFSKHILEDDYFFVTHSLGSRITVDTLAYAAKLSKKLGPESPQAKKLFDALKEKEFQVYMLSNQLPLLQLGQEDPPITGKHAEYCTPQGSHYDERIFKKINLVAFSDPNDVLSYPIPSNYKQKNLDSRLCADIVNVNINVAHVKSAFGIDFANPLEAHGGYWGDDRVAEIVKNGINRQNSTQARENSCKWVETVP